MNRSISRKIKPKDYPYQNLSMANMPGEIWKPIEGYEDFYQVSNQGRIKALDRYIEFTTTTNHHISYWKKARILRQGDVKVYNKTIKKYSHILLVTFCVEQKMDTQSVARLVYQTFIERIQFAKDGQYVIHIDAEPCNNQANNLALSDRSAISKLSFARKRSVSFFKGMDLMPFLAQRSKKLFKPITQYDLNGKRIRIYESVKAAAEATNIYCSNISLAAKGKKLDMGGFIWQYGQGSRSIDISAYQKSKQAIKQKMCKIVTQYDMHGKKLMVFPSIAEAARCNNIIATSIQLAANGKYDTAGGFFWRLGTGNKSINVSGYKTRLQKTKLALAKPVVRSKAGGQKKKKYESIADAARDMHCSDDCISRALRKPDRLYRGYKWTFSAFDLPG